MLDRRRPRTCTSRGPAAPRTDRRRYSCERLEHAARRVERAVAALSPCRWPARDRSRSLRRASASKRRRRAIRQRVDSDRAVHSSALPMTRAASSSDHRRVCHLDAVADRSQSTIELSVRSPGSPRSPAAPFSPFSGAGRASSGVNARLQRLRSCAPRSRGQKRRSCRQVR